MCRSHETLEQRGRHRDPWHGVTSAAIESDMLQKMAAEQRVFVLASIPPGRADFQTKSRRWSRGCPPRSARFRQERLPISRVAAPRTERPRSETTSPIDQRNVPLMKTFSLAPLTVLDVGPRDLIPLAAESGYRAVGIRLCAPTPGGLEYPLRPGSSDIRAIRRFSSHTTNCSSECARRGCCATGKEPSRRDPTRRTGRASSRVECWGKIDFAAHPCVNSRVRDA